MRYAKCAHRRAFAKLSIIFFCSAVLFAAKDKHTVCTITKYSFFSCWAIPTYRFLVFYIEVVRIEAEIRSIFCSSEGGFFTLAHTSQSVFGPYYFMRQNPSTAMETKTLESMWNVRVVSVFILPLCGNLNSKDDKKAINHGTQNSFLNDLWHTQSGRELERREDSGKKINHPQEVRSLRSFFVHSFCTWKMFQLILTAIHSANPSWRSKTKSNKLIVHTHTHARARMEWNNNYHFELKISNHNFLCWIVNWICCTLFFTIYFVMCIGGI